MNKLFKNFLNVKRAHRNKCTKPKLYVKLSEYRINPAVKLKYMYGKQVLIRKRHIKYFNRTMHIHIKYRTWRSKYIIKEKN